MPRPMRTKVVPSAPAPRLKKASNQPNRVVAEAVKAPFDDLYDVSDQETRAPPRVSRAAEAHGKSKTPVVSEMRRVATSIGREDDVSEHETSAVEERRALADGSDAEPNMEDIDLDSSSPAVEVGRKNSLLGGGDSMLAIGNFKRRARQPSVLGRGAGHHRSSSIDSILAFDNGPTSVGRKNTSAMGNTRRRPRKDSDLRPKLVEPSSMALEMERGTTPNVGSALKIGRFKRREREPSVLNTGRKAQRRSVQYDDDDEGDDFNPDDESTPLNRSKGNQATSSSVLSTSSSKKRKLSAIQVPQSSPIQAIHGEIGSHDSIPATGDIEGQVEEVGQESDQEQSEPVLPSVEACLGTPEPFSETMAPPLSSSPASPSPELPSRMTTALPRGRRPLRGRTTPPPRTQDSPISSPPSLTHSPNRPTMVTTKHKPKKEAPPPATLSTAQLQAFMPRRRRRPAHDTFSIASSEDGVDVSALAPDDDELSHLNVRARSRTATTIHRQTPAPRRKVTKLKGPAKSVVKSTSKRTYGRPNSASDKENEAEADPDDSLGPLPDDENQGSENSQELEKRVGKELKQAVRKFAEVDKWELEFEDVTASSSSPKDAR